jgi:hypothetical protein
MPHTLTLVGSMYEFNYVEISDNDIQRLVDSNCSDDYCWLNLDDLYEKIMGDRILSGFVCDHADSPPQIYLDGEQVVLDRVIALPECQSAPRALSSHYLVIEQWSKHGVMDQKFNGKFNPSNFSFEVEVASLPNGFNRMVLNVWYEDGDFTFQGSRPAYESVYIIRSDGTKIAIF